jgi:hypothetical protein
MNIERVQNPVQKAMQLAGVASACNSNTCNSNTCNSNSNSNSNSNAARSRAGSLEEMRQLYRQLSASLPQQLR